MIPLPLYSLELERVYAGLSDAGLKTVAVTAVQPGEGASTLAYALARRAAAVGRRALLVDLNLNSPSVALRLGLERADWQPGQASERTAQIHFKRAGLSVLPAPARVSETLRLHDQDLMRATLARWREDCDLIVIDAAPLLSADTDALLPERICAACDGTVLVLNAGETQETSLREAAGRLQATGARLCGAVVNDRFNPPLAGELIRECDRLRPWLPGVAKRLASFVRRSTVLNLSL